MPLRESDSRLADIFAGLMPAPGGPFAGQAWRRHRVRAGAGGRRRWAGCGSTRHRAFGWGRLIEATLDEVELAPRRAAHRWSITAAGTGRR